MRCTNPLGGALRADRNPTSPQLLQAMHGFQHTRRLIHVWGSIPILHTAPAMCCRDMLCCREYEDLVPETWHVVNDADMIPRFGKFVRLYKRPGARVIVDRKGSIVVRPTALELHLRPSEFQSPPLWLILIYNGRKLGNAPKNCPNWPRPAQYHLGHPLKIPIKPRDSLLINPGNPPGMANPGCKHLQSYIRPCGLCFAIPYLNTVVTPSNLLLQD